MSKEKHRKADAATIRERVLEVLNIRLMGATFVQVQQYSAEKGWGGNPGEPLSERQLRLYWARSDKLIGEQQERKRRKIIDLHLARREDLYARAVAGADIKTALAVLGDIARLQGLYPSPADVRELSRVVAEQARTINELESSKDAA